MAQILGNSLEEVLIDSYKALDFPVYEPDQEHKIAVRALEKIDIAYSVIDNANGIQPKNLINPFLELYGDTKANNEPITLDSKLLKKKFREVPIKNVFVLSNSILISTLALNFLYPSFFNPYTAAASIAFLSSSFVTDAYTSTKFKNSDYYHEGNPLVGDKSGNFRYRYLLRPVNVLVAGSCIFSSFLNPTVGFGLGLIKHYAAIHNHKLRIEEIKGEIKFLESFTKEKVHLFKELYEER
jgi:hypothetical protein